MRKVVYGGATSLDQFLAHEDGSVDWLIMDAESMELMKDMWGRFDVMLMGRKTWATAMEQFSEDDLKRAEEAKAPTTPSSEADATPPQAGGEPETYVFSRTLEPGHKGGYEIVNDDPGEFVRELKKQDGKDICVMGGGELAAVLFEAGLIDEVGFNIHPIMLGSGIPAFRKVSRSIDLKLTECKAMKNGCVYVKYDVVNDD